MVRIEHLAITSQDIRALERIPDEHTAAGGSTVPRLRITGIPHGAVELSIILHDPDAPMPRGFTHWVCHGVPAIDGAANLEGAILAPNSMGERAYVGPFPPAGHGLHHYYFWVYAMGDPVSGSPAREEFLETYAEHIIEQARFVATYSTSTETSQSH